MNLKFVTVVNSVITWFFFINSSYWFTTKACSRLTIKTLKQCVVLFKFNKKDKVTLTRVMRGICKGGNKEMRADWTNLFWVNKSIRIMFENCLKPTLEDVKDFYLQARIQMKLFLKKIKNTRRRCEIYVQS